MRVVWWPILSYIFCSENIIVNAGSEPFPCAYARVAAENVLLLAKLIRLVVLQAAQQTVNSSDRSPAAICSIAYSTDVDMAPCVAALALAQCVV